jgi:hypothetical protein
MAVPASPPQRDGLAEPGPQVLKTKAVLVDAPQSGVEVGDDLLPADDEYDGDLSGSLRLVLREPWISLLLRTPDSLPFIPPAIRRGDDEGLISLDQCFKCILELLSVVFAQR